MLAAESIQKENSLNPPCIAAGEFWGNGWGLSGGCVLGPGPRAAPARAIVWYEDSCPLSSARGGWLETISVTFSFCARKFPER